MHYYPHNIADYRKDTRFLSKLQHWAYRELLDEYYLSEQPITKNEKDLFWRMGALLDEEQNAIKVVLDGFFEETENGFIHKRCDIEIQIFKAFLDKKSRAGKASAFSRNKGLNTCSTHVQHEVGGVQQTNNQETITKNKETRTKVQAPEGVDPSLWKDYLKIRSAKKKPITDTAIEAIKREAIRANKTLSEAITLCVENGWIGFKADWDTVQATIPRKQPGI